MAKTKNKKKNKKAEPVELIDPVFPLPANTGPPPVRQGEGSIILHNDEATRVVELPYRAFWILWEHVEKRGAETYVRYNGGPLDHVAQAYLEGVVAFRNADRAKTDLAPLEVFDPKTERKLRKKQNKGQKAPEAATPSPNGSKPAASESKATPEPVEEDRCTEKHKVDGKKRRCVRKPDHKGRHKDRKGDRW
jgi:hypothetical protein